MASTLVREETGQVTVPSSAPARGTTSAPAPPQLQDASPASASTATRNLLVILHGKRVDDELLRNALQEVKQQGHKLTVRVTWDRGDVEHFIAEAVRLNDGGAANYQTIVAGGGDGTLNEVVGAMMQHREAIVRQGLSIALIPLGTANDFACTAGISVDPREALRLALDPSLIRPIDVATLNGKPFINVAVAGGLAEVPADELSSRWKRLLGPVAIAFYVLKRLSSKKVLQPHSGATISFNPHPEPTGSSIPQLPPPSQHDTPSEQDHHQEHQPKQQQQQQQQQQQLKFEVDLLMLVAGNSRQMGRTVAVCPDALLDDGLLDFTLLSGASLATQAAALVSALSSRDDNESAHDSGICQLRASRLEVAAAGSSSNGSSSEVISVNRDGEPEDASSRLVFEVLPRALPMHLPDDRLLVSGQADKRTARRNGTTTTATTSDVITGSIKTPGSDSFIAASSVVSAAHAAGKSPQESGGGSTAGSKRGRGGRRQRKPNLTVKTLRRMLTVAGPEGYGVRRQHQLLALGRQLCVTLGVVLLGGAMGWVVGGRRAARAADSSQQPLQQQQKETQQLPTGGDKRQDRKARREQRREEGRRQSQRINLGAVV